MRVPRRAFACVTNMPFSPQWFCDSPIPYTVIHVHTKSKFVVREVNIYTLEINIHDAHKCIFHLTPVCELSLTRTSNQSEVYVPRILWYVGLTRSATAYPTYPGFICRSFGTRKKLLSSTVVTISSLLVSRQHRSLTACLLSHLRCFRIFDIVEVVDMHCCEGSLRSDQGPKFINCAIKNFVI